MAGMRVVVVTTGDEQGNVDLDDLRGEDRRSTPTGSPRSWSPTRRRTACSRSTSARSARSCTTPAARSTSTARTSTRWSALARPGQVRRRRLAPQPAQDVLHPARRRRPRRRPDRRARAPRAVPAEPPAAADGRPGDGQRRDRGGAVGLGRRSCRSPWAYIRMMGARRADRGHRRRDPDRELPRARGSRRTTRCSTPARNGLVAHECILDLRADHQRHRRHRRRRRQAAHRLRLPRADDVVPGRGHADGRADRVRGPRASSTGSSTR